ncbi:MAG: hypothetical protein NVSMB51_02060 [Solirubrobacteraceae bacterium]
MIGLAEDPAQYERRGYRPEAQATGYIAFRNRFGMPFATEPRRRLLATGPACRAIVAARLRDPGSEWDVFRKLQLHWFTTPELLDEQAVLGRVLDDPALVAAALGDAEVERLYQADRELTRTAAGSPTDFQGKAANTDGATRYTAPSVIFELNGTKLEAGGFQTLGAYDVLLATLASGGALTRYAPPDGPLPALEHFRHGLTTQEVAQLLAPNLAEPDRRGAEAALIMLASEGRATRAPLGDDALWRVA